jgi:hypothetical protein
MTTPGTAVQVAITWRSTADAAVVIEGTDIAPICRSVRLDLAWDAVPQLVLEIDPLIVEAFAGDADVRLDLDTHSRVTTALTAAGWTPPDEQSGHRPD